MDSGPRPTLLERRPTLTEEEASRRLGRPTLSQEVAVMGNPTPTGTSDAGFSAKPLEAATLHAVPR